MIVNTLIIKFNGYETTRSIASWDDTPEQAASERDFRLLFCCLSEDMSARAVKTSDSGCFCL